MTLPAEVKKAFHISKQLFAEPGMMERVEKLQFEACRLAGKRLSMMPARFVFLLEGATKRQRVFWTRLNMNTRSLCRTWQREDD